jgi:type IV pilus assembly protein PilM
MALFSFPKLSSYLGIDIGTSGVKILECVNEKGTPRLANYGFSAEPLETVGIHNLRDNPPECAAVIQQILTKARITTKKVIASLPTFSVFSSVITLDNPNPASLEGEIKEKAKRIIPLPLEEMSLDWKQLPKTEMTGKTTETPPPSEGVITEKIKQPSRLLIIAAQRKLVNQYIEIFKLAKLELLSLETEAFALIRSLAGNDRAPLMIVDIGAVTTDISIIKDLTPILDRSLEIGGVHITKTISETLSVNLAHAEEIKRDLGLSLKGEQNLALRNVQELLNPIIHEIRYTANLYGSTISKILLTGGSAFLPSLPEYLQSALNARVIVGDPWSRLIYPKGLEPVLQEIGPRFAVASGLAMREIS